MTIHLKIRFFGTGDAIDVFNNGLKAIDRDYPYDPFRSPHAQAFHCEKCGGVEWPCALLVRQDLHRYAAQCGIRIKLKMYSDCRGTCTPKPLVEIRA